MRTLILFFLAAAATFTPLSHSIAQVDALTFCIANGEDDSTHMRARLISVHDTALLVYSGLAPDYRLMADTTNMALLPLTNVQYIYEEPPLTENTITGWAPLQGAILGAIIGGLVLIADPPEGDDFGDAAGAAGIEIAQDHPWTFMAIITGLGAALGLAALVYSSIAEVQIEPTIVYRQGDDLECLKELAFVQENRSPGN